MGSTRAARSVSPVRCVAISMIAPAWSAAAAQRSPAGPVVGSVPMVSRMSMSPASSAPSRSPAAGMPSARSPAPLTSAHISIARAPGVAATTRAMASAAAGSAARSASSHSTTARWLPCRRSLMTAAASSRCPGVVRSASHDASSAVGRGPITATRAPARRALRMRSSATGCWVHGSPPTTSTTSAPSMSSICAPGSARMGPSPWPGIPVRATMAGVPPPTRSASSHARNPVSTVTASPSRIPTRAPRADSSPDASVTARSSGTFLRPTASARMGACRRPVLRSAG